MTKTTSADPASPEIDWVAQLAADAIEAARMEAPSADDVPDPPTLADLASHPRWVAWHEEPRNGEMAKVPYSLRTRRQAKADDPATWGTRDQAETASRRFANGSAGGVGIMLGDLGDGRALGGIDLDTCRDDTGRFEPWATEIMTRFATYAEVSPSGTGAKLYFLYDADDLADLRAAMGTAQWGKQWKRGKGRHPPAIELHLGNRYFAVTRDWVAGRPLTLATVPTPDLVRLIQMDGPAFASGAEAPAHSTDGHDTSRSAVAMRIGSAAVRNGATFDEMVAAIEADPEGAAWCEEKGHAYGDRELHRIFAKASQPEWQRSLQVTNNGGIVSNFSNAMIVLRFAPELREYFRYDEMARAAVLVKPLPSNPMEGGLPRPIRDDDVAQVWEWLQRHGGLVRIGDDTVQKAVAKRARECAYHPVRDYLDALAWDGVPRLETWLADYAGAKRTPYTAAIGRMLMIMIVARVRKPGCKADYAVIFEDRNQGTFKSTLTRELAIRDEWFSDALPDLHGDEVRISQHLRGKLVIELSELSALRKTEVNNIRRFITKQDEKFTAKYAKNEATESRQCVFIGTTNEEMYLKDETGNRRFWPIATGKIDIEAFKRDRDQLFAEANTLHAQGEHWWPTPEFEAEHIKPEQDDRVIEEPWHDRIADYLASTEAKNIRITNILENVLFIEPRLQTQLHIQKVAGMLRDLGWDRDRSHGRKFWARSGAEPSTAKPPKPRAGAKSR